MTTRLEESQQQLLEVSNFEDFLVKELRKLSQERDRVWQSEVEAIQKQHSMDSAALPSALNKIQKHKTPLELVAESEATQSMRVEAAHSEIKNLRVKLLETCTLVEKMRKQLNECKGFEAHALEVASEAQVQREETMKSSENLRFEGLKAKDAYNSFIYSRKVHIVKVYKILLLVIKVKSVDVAQIYKYFVQKSYISIT